MGESGRRTDLDLCLEQSETQTEFRVKTTSRNLPDSLLEAHKEVETNKASCGHVVGMPMDASLGQTGKDRPASNHGELAIDHVFRSAERCEYLRVIGDTDSDNLFLRLSQRISTVSNQVLRHASVNNRS